MVDRRMGSWTVPVHSRDIAFKLGPPKPDTAVWLVSAGRGQSQE